MPRLAFSDIFGTNLLALCSWWASPIPVRRSSIGWVRSRPLPRHSASLLTSIYAAGLIERRDTAVGSLGLTAGSCAATISEVSLSSSAALTASCECHARREVGPQSRTFLEEPFALMLRLLLWPVNVTA